MSLVSIRVRSRPSLRCALGARLAPLQVVAALVVLTALAGVGAVASAAAASELNLTGKWQTNYHCTGGPCPGTNFPDLITLAQATGSDAINGTDDHGATFTGVLNGNSLDLTGKVGSYVATLRVVVSSDGTSWSGTASDNNGTSGIETGRRISGPGQSVTQVFCDLESPDTPGAVFTCTAVVGDARGFGQLVAPTGTVSFALDAGAGGGLEQSSCTLALSQTGGDTAMCSVLYRPPAGGVPIGSEPSLTASYGGDTTFMPSSGRPIGLGPQNAQAATAQTAIAQAVDQNATDCLDQAQSATVGGQASSGGAQQAAFVRPELTSPPAVQYQPTDSKTDRVVKTCIFPLRGVGYVVGGVFYAGGAVGSFLGDPKVAGATMLAGAGTCGYGIYAGPAAPLAEGVGAATFIVGGINYYVAQPIGRGLDIVGSVVINDPPDPHFRVVAQASPVSAIPVASGSPAFVHDLVALKLAEDRARADLTAMSTAINRAGGAAKARDKAAQGRQARSALSLGRSASTELGLVLVEERDLGRDMAVYARSYKPLTASQLTKARAALSGKTKLAPAVLQLLKAFGVTPLMLRSALGKVRDGAKVAASVQVSPAFSGDVTFGRALLTLYPKVPQIATEAKLR